MSVNGNVRTLLSALLNHTYIFFSKGSKDKEVDLRGVYTSDELSIYKTLDHKAKKILWFDKQLDYDDFRIYFSKIHEEEPESLYDITSFTKEHISDILALSLVYNINSIFHFKIKKHIDYTHPWTTLFHDLSPLTDNPDYEYTDVTKRHFFKECNKDILFRRTRLTLSLLLTSLLLVIITLTSFILGSLNDFARVTNGSIGALATVASLLSIIFYFFPPRRST
jgi:hypothetical protein